MCTALSKVWKLHGPASTWEHQKQINIKHIGKSASRKLRWAIYYTVYRTDPKQTHNKYMFAHQSQKSETYTARLPFGSIKQTHKVITKTILCKKIGKSSSRKLHRAIYYILYRMNPQKT